MRSLHTNLNLRVILKVVQGRVLRHCKQVRGTCIAAVKVSKEPELGWQRKLMAAAAARSSCG